MWRGGRQDMETVLIDVKLYKRDYVREQLWQIQGEKRNSLGYITVCEFNRRKTIMEAKKTR